MQVRWVLLIVLTEDADESMEPSREDIDLGRWEDRMIKVGRLSAEALGRSLGWEVYQGSWLSPLV